MSRWPVHTDGARQPTRQVHTGRGTQAGAMSEQRVQHSESPELWECGTWNAVLSSSEWLPHCYDVSNAPMPTFNGPFSFSLSAV